jgi:hypothetical protein
MLVLPVWVGHSCPTKSGNQHSPSGARPELVEGRTLLNLYEELKRVVIVIPNLFAERGQVRDLTAALVTTSECGILAMLPEKAMAPDSISTPLSSCPTRHRSATTLSLLRRIFWTR